MTERTTLSLLPGSLVMLSSMITIGANFSMELNNLRGSSESSFPNFSKKARGNPTETFIFFSLFMTPLTNSKVDEILHSSVGPTF